MADKDLRPLIDQLPAGRQGHAGRGAHPHLPAGLGLRRQCAGQPQRAVRALLSRLLAAQSRAPSRLHRPQPRRPPGRPVPEGAATSNADVRWGCAQAEFASAFRAGPTSPGAAVSHPEGLPHKRELAHVGSVFPTVEINGTFYSMQRPEVFGRWAELMPDDFVFAVKGPRFLTHMKRLNEPVAPLGNFIASGLLRLGRQARPDPVAVPAELPLRPREARSLLQAAAARHRAARCLRPPARPPAEGAGLAAHRSASPAAAACARGPPRELPRPGLHRPAAPIRHGAGLRRHGRLAAADGSHRPTSSTAACTARASSIAAATAPPRSSRWAERIACVARRQADARRHLRRRDAAEVRAARRVRLFRQHRQAQGAAAMPRR